MRHRWGGMVTRACLRNREGRVSQEWSIAGSVVTKPIVGVADLVGATDFRDGSLVQYLEALGRQVGCDLFCRPWYALRRDPVDPSKSC